MAYSDTYLLSIWKKQLRNQTTTWNKAGSEMINPLEIEHRRPPSSSRDVIGSGSTIQQVYQQQPEQAFDVSFIGEDSSLKVFMITLLACILLLGTIGNLCAIYIFKTKSRSGFKGLRRQLALLASVDLVSSITLPALLIYLIVSSSSDSTTNGGRWIFGGFGCSVFPAFHQVIITCVEGILMLVTYEKYTIIEKPFYQQKLPSNSILTWCFLIVFTAILMSIPEASSYSLVTGVNGGKCLVAAGSPSLKMASASIYLVRDLLALILTFYLIKKTGKLVKQNCMVNFPHSVKLTGAKRRSKVVWILVLSTFVLVLPGDVYNVLQQCISHVNQQQHHQEQLLLASGILLFIQISRSCSSFIVYSCTHPEFIKRWCSLGSCRENHSVGVSSRKNIVIDVVAAVEDYSGGSSFSGCDFSSVSTPQDYQRRQLMLPSSPYKHQLIVNMKDEYLNNCLTETSSCSSSMF